MVCLCVVDVKHRCWAYPHVCLVVVFLLLLTSWASSSSSHDIKDGCADEEFSYTQPDEPDIIVQGCDVMRGVCLSKNDDRFHVVPSQKHPLSDTSSHSSTLYLLATDLCAMGHTTKDPAHFLSFLLDYFAVSEQNSTIDLHVVFGNTCMAQPGGPGGNKRTKVFHGVLLGWFRAIFRVDSPLHQALLAMGAVIREGDTVNEGGQRVSLFVREHFFHHMPSRFCGIPSSSESFPYLTAVKRQEHWRWFRTRRHAAVFRSCLLEHYGIVPKNITTSTFMRHLVTSLPDPNSDSSSSSSPLIFTSASSLNSLGMAPFHVVILRRDEDRHFSEEAVQRVVSSILPRHAVLVHLVTFDNIRGSKGKPPPSFTEQLEYLSKADVFIAAHGAGLSSIIAMRPGGVVVELFPSNFRYYMYQELAQLLSLKYMAVESDRVWPTGCCRGSKEPLLALDFPSHMNGVGARACKKCDVRLTLGQLHRILREALGFVSLGRPWHVVGGEPFVLD